MALTFCANEQIGGATGSVGDPSGRSTERQALDPIILAQNTAAITSQVTAFLTTGVPFAQSRTNQRYGIEASQGEEEGRVKVVNNLEWLGQMGLLEFLSGVGKTARMGTMLSRERLVCISLALDLVCDTLTDTLISITSSVKSRLDSVSGLSFTEFTYQLLQAYDFLTLHRTQDCTIQLGGSDQLGNIMSGIEMIRKSSNPNEAIDVEEPGVDSKVDQPAYGVTMPLLTTATGEKFGKSAGNAIWLDPTMTSPFAFYQVSYNHSCRI